MRDHLEVALWCIENDRPIPVDVHATLIEQGIDISGLEPSTPADTQLHLLDAQSELDL